MGEKGADEVRSELTVAEPGPDLQPDPAVVRGVRFPLLALFLAVTFGLSWGIPLVTAMSTGKGPYGASELPPLGMLIPAFVALLLQVFVSGESKIHFRKITGAPRLIIYAYLLLTVLVGLLTVVSLFTEIPGAVLRSLGNVLFVLWPLLIIRLHRRHGEAAFERGGLQLGDRNRGVRFVLGVVLFLLVQAGLNGVLGLGDYQGIQESIAGMPVPRALYPFALIAFLFLTVVGTPLGGLAVTFGEEYAWRGFLQTELVKLGRRRGVLLVGLIWGIWHTPIILSGVHTYPPTPIGFLFAIVFFILWGFVQSYAVMKTNSIWVAAFLHGVVNGVYAFTLNYLVRPDNKLFSFGLGFYGLLCLGAVVLVILRDPVWKAQTSA